MESQPKRVRRITREDNLLCLRLRKYWATTDSRHGFAVYPNLAGELELTDVNQLWIADITYIRLETEFVYLAVVLDAFSRRVSGWALDRTLESKLTLASLHMALSCRNVSTGLMHHSDRGVQYVADDYTGLLDRQARLGSVLLADLLGDDRPIACAARYRPLSCARLRAVTGM